MVVLKKVPANLRVSLVICLLPAVVGGCGGGASGTGIQGAVYEAQVVDSSGAPIAGATVTNQQTGEAVTTDATGHFAIALDSSADSNTIQVDGTVCQLGWGLAAGSRLPAGLPATEYVERLDRLRG